MDTQLKKGVIEICVLSILRKKDFYGYELVQKISNNIIVSEGTLYPLLRRLKKEGHLKTYIKESKEGPPRKYYSLTKKGEKREKDLRKEWISFSKKIENLMKDE